MSSLLWWRVQFLDRTTSGKTTSCSEILQMLIPVCHGRNHVQCFQEINGRLWKDRNSKYHSSRYSNPMATSHRADSNESCVSFSWKYIRFLKYWRLIFWVCSGWLHAELPIGGGIEALRGFDNNVKKSYKLGMHGGMWEFFRGMYLIPMPLLKAYTTWGETNIPPVILSSIPGTMSRVNIYGLPVLQSYPVLSLGCSMGIYRYR